MDEHLFFFLRNHGFRSNFENPKSIPGIVYDLRVTRISLNTVRHSNTHSDIVDHELFESVGAYVSGLLCCTITDVGHQILTLEPTAHPVVDTLRFPPVLLKRKTHITELMKLLSETIFVNYCVTLWHILITSSLWMKLRCLSDKIKFVMVSKIPSKLESLFYGVWSNISLCWKVNCPSVPAVLDKFPA